ncbi:hypothetical protein QA612_12975 [Evansella sp. AB-P1]|uniref:hypothetical protein n=1 Tax=Evansella sp. AB-P1 TaxID=3037653 RepID=UPI00241F9489|nr:hypothetical protein [Evansella sp. AB-P1]MDG5788395.1 hypothetical protein [Evansella sp. AB-P1]
MFLIEIAIRLFILFSLLFISHFVLLLISQFLKVKANNGSESSPYFYLTASICSMIVYIAIPDFYPTFISMIGISCFLVFIILLIKNILKRNSNRIRK